MNEVALLPDHTVADHFVIVSEQLDALAAAFESAGFQLTDRSAHRELGTQNRLLILENNYIELLGTPAESPLRSAAGWRSGLTAVALRASGVADLYQQLRKRGSDLTPPIRFQRDVTDAGTLIGSASFTVSMFAASVVPGFAGTFLCEHHTPDLVFREAWRRHSNGVTRLAAVSIVCDSPPDAVELMRKTFALVVRSQAADRIEVEIAGTTLIVTTPEAFTRDRNGFVWPADWQTPLAAALLFHTADLQALRRKLMQTRLRTYESTGGGFALDPSLTGGVMLEFSV